ncbi:hypothetical protein [Haliscomenobacter sp.]|uniref:hypothetical protein n=1 Tax=Haliscomenobacter sp. TaxID=2717303 RepID=UPI003593375D
MPLWYGLYIRQNPKPDATIRHSLFEKFVIPNRAGIVSRWYPHFVPTGLGETLGLLDATPISSLRDSGKSWGCWMLPLFRPSGACRLPNPFSYVYLIFYFGSNV